MRKVRGIGFPRAAAVPGHGGRGDGSVQSQRIGPPFPSGPHSRRPRPRAGPSLLGPRLPAAFPIRFSPPHEAPGRRAGRVSAAAAQRGHEGPPTQFSPRWNMRTKLLGSMALLLGAVSFLGGADGRPRPVLVGLRRATAIPRPTTAYQGTSPVSFRNYNYVQAGQSAWYSPYYYYPGYGYYPNYSYYNQYYNRITTRDTRDTRDPTPTVPQGSYPSAAIRVRPCRQCR